ncbi:MAG TPA: NAD(P)-dependent oxidoreductase [Xanthobacteraceae bacterium]|nr:NAD(P)-dependent oxidoreductase [Xanthobacteraceae bacterium]
MDIGFIGLGNMGAHMARRLIEAGHRVTVYDLRQEAMGRLTARGATAARSIAEVADVAETVMASLPTPDIVLEVTTGPRGVCEGQRVRRFVDLSTSGSAMAQRIFKMLAAHNIVQIDCPVSGGVRGAESGTLALMASGPCAEIAAIEPALAAIGKVFFISERPGAGQTMKLVNNVLSATAMAATAEAMVMGVKAGLDPRIMLDVINAGTGRNTATEDKFARIVLPGTFDLGFTAGLMMKDVKLFLAESRVLGVPTQVIEAVARLLQLTCDELGMDADLTTIVRPVEKRAGIEVRTPRP